MSHKVHPKIFKIKDTKDWLSRGFYQDNLPKYLEEDFVIRRFLDKKLSHASVQDIEIERTVNASKIIIKTARPALVIGRGGKGVEELRQGLEREFAKIKTKTRKDSSLKPAREMKFEILEIRSPWTSAKLVGQWVAGQIEKMVPFRRALKMALRKVAEQKEVKGVRIQVSGRLNGIEIARTEWLQEGRLPRQNLRAVIDYSLNEAYCTYGVIGVKVWIYKGEKLN